MGLSVLDEARGGLSDANYFGAVWPTLDGLGPSGQNAHCSERSADGKKVPELLERDSVLPKALLNYAPIFEDGFYASKFCEQPGNSLDNMKALAAQHDQS
jgi:glutamate carboxypeptidase